MSIQSIMSMYSAVYINYSTKLLKTLKDVDVAEYCIFETSLVSFWSRINSFRKYYGSYRLGMDV